MVDHLFGVYFYFKIAPGLLLVCMVAECLQGVIWRIVIKIYEEFLGCYLECHGYYHMFSRSTSGSYFMKSSCISHFLSLSIFAFYELYVYGDVWNSIGWSLWNPPCIQTCGPRSSCLYAEFEINGLPLVMYL